MIFPPCNLTEMTEALFQAGLKTPPMLTVSAQPVNERERKGWLDAAVADLLMQYDLANWAEEQESQRIRAEIMGASNELIVPDTRIIH